MPVLYRQGPDVLVDPDPIMAEDMEPPVAPTRTIAAIHADIAALKKHGRVASKCVVLAAQIEIVDALREMGLHAGIDRACGYVRALDADQTRVLRTLEAELATEQQRQSDRVLAAFDACASQVVPGWKAA